MAESSPLQWGQHLSAQLEDDAVSLSAVSLRGEPLLDRWYFAARDNEWRTVPLTIQREHETQADGFVARFSAVSAAPSFPLVVQAEFIADHGGITARMTAIARGDFAYNRIGWCLLHPTANHAGVPFTSHHEGAPITGRLPIEIAPQPHVDGAPRSFLRSFDRFALTLDACDVEYRFSGDLFEIEDQRNWSDPSFKTYSTPLAEGFPRQARKGQRFEQSVSLSVRSHLATNPVGASEPRPVTEGYLPLITLGNTTTFAPGAFRPRNGFVEFNRIRPQLHNATLVLGINGAVHTADDVSVMASTHAHGEIVRQAARLAEGCTIVIDPLDFSNEPGEWYSSRGVFAPSPPRVSDDPRRTGEFAVTWLIASITSCVDAGANTLAYFDRSVENAPVGHTIQRLRSLRGSAIRLLHTPPGVRGFTLASQQWLANTTNAPVAVDGLTLPPFGNAVVG